MSKTINITEDNWKRLMQLKLDIEHCDKLDHVITLLLKEYKEYNDIKKYDTIIPKNGECGLKGTLTINGKKVEIEGEK